MLPYATVIVKLRSKMYTGSVVKNYAQYVGHMVYMKIENVGSVLMR